jgi:hypothetical protein
MVGVGGRNEDVNKHWKLWIRSLKAMSYWTQFSCIAFAGIYAIILLILRRLNMMPFEVDYILNCVEHIQILQTKKPFLYHVTANIVERIP